MTISPTRFRCAALALEAVLDVAIDALDASRFREAGDALEAYCRRRRGGNVEPYTNADRRARDAWAELAEQWREGPNGDTSRGMGESRCASGVKILGST